MKDTFFGRVFNRLRSYASVLLQQGRVQLDSDTNENFFGIYRAVVISNIDPQNLMRIKVKVVGVLGGEDAIFAQACLPAVNSQVSLPTVGASVWVMFEGGDRNHPVWVGSLVGQG